MGRRTTNIVYRKFPDMIYRDNNIEKFINIVMIDGKKFVARNIVYGALNSVYGQINDNYFTIPTLFEKILRNTMPECEVRSRRVGGATYQVPCELKTSRAKFIAMRFLRDATKKIRKTNKTTTMKALAEEMYEAFNNRGESIRMKDEKHKVAKANMSYAHYR